MDLVNQTKVYRTLNNIHYSCQYHVIFCPKYRRKVLINGIDDRLKQLIEEKQEEYGYTILSLDIMSDHIHMILDIQPDMSVGSVVSRIKAYTSHILRDEFTELKSRLPTLWTRNFFISSVGNVSLKDIEVYIEDQKNF